MGAHAKLTGEGKEGEGEEGEGRGAAGGARGALLGRWGLDPVAPLFVRPLFVPAVAARVRKKAACRKEQRRERKEKKKRRGKRKIF
jgi:hypothetical protein